jgi:hypothetical protein
MTHHHHRRHYLTIPSNTEGPVFFCQGFLPQLTGPHFKASESRSPPLHDLAVYILPKYMNA